MRINLANIRRILNFWETFDKGHHAIDGRELNEIYKIIFGNGKTIDPGTKIRSIREFVNNHYMELQHEAAIPEMPPSAIGDNEEIIKERKIIDGIEVDVYKIIKKK